jgi:16S rRNA (uracil1498-N3)-methyltransferase
VIEQKTKGTEKIKSTKPQDDHVAPSGYRRETRSADSPSTKACVCHEGIYFFWSFFSAVVKISRIMNEFSKTPRLFIEAECTPGKKVALSKSQSHYVQNVLRLSIGDFLRVFDGQNGECLATIIKNGKQVEIQVQKTLRPQESNPGPWLFFSPLKKTAMDFLIEKATEIGASSLCPVLMDRSIVRSINVEKIQAHLIEAAEQCERLDIPALLPLTPLKDIFKVLPTEMPLYFCQERSIAPHISSVTHNPQRAVLIGPEGGFTDQEIAMLLKTPQVHPVSLGKNILRAETAALYALSHLHTSSHF